MGLWKGGGKVGVYKIERKYIRGFFGVCVEDFYKRVIEKCVEEDMFLRRMESVEKGRDYNIWGWGGKERREG